jgi:hypothetical protein
MCRFNDQALPRRRRRRQERLDSCSFTIATENLIAIIRALEWFSLSRVMFCDTDVQNPHIRWMRGNDSLIGILVTFFVEDGNLFIGLCAKRWGDYFTCISINRKLFVYKLLVDARVFLHYTIFRQFQNLLCCAEVDALISDRNKRKQIYKKCYISCHLLPLAFQQLNQ